MSCQWVHVAAIDNAGVVVVVAPGCAADCFTSCPLRNGERDEIPTVHQNDSSADPGLSLDSI